MLNHEKLRNFLVATFVVTIFYSPSQISAQTNLNDDPVTWFLGFFSQDKEEREAALSFVKRTWKPSYLAMMLEVLNFNRDPNLYRELVTLLEQNTGQQLGFDLDAWYQWLWSQPPDDHPNYAGFKSALYANIDDVFAGYFSDERHTEIRLDEIRWGGVPQDGIPPLRNPKMITAEEADYLGYDNIVFGLEINGDARAYPKRIMAWHEMFTDTVGGIEMAGVYCTLCGAMILYETEHNGTKYQVGTSGFLYRSNKLMYDKATQSLWNTLQGKPVVGPLVGKDIELNRSYLVTTTWGEWLRRHPDTTVLSLETGHRRDYSEGAAYRDYFATDELMFVVPFLDERLQNKAEVLGLVFPQYTQKPMAISADYLAENPIYHAAMGDLELVVLTDSSGANRVYESKDIRFIEWDQDATVIDESGNNWTLSEDKLMNENGQSLNRLPAHRSFWFGWLSAYNHTDLVK